MTAPDIAAFRALVEAIIPVLDDPGLLGLHTDELDCSLCRVRLALEATFPAAQEALERVEKILALQRAALALWQMAHPESCVIINADDRDGPTGLRP